MLDLSHESMVPRIANSCLFHRPQPSGSFALTIGEQSGYNEGLKLSHVLPITSSPGFETQPRMNITTVALHSFTTARWPVSLLVCACARSVIRGWLVVVLAFLALSSTHAERPPAPPVTTEPKVLLKEHCYACHAEGNAEGKFSIDDLLVQPDGESTRTAWWRVLKNLRAEMMPPHSEPKLSEAARRQLIQWLEIEALHLDPQRPDPGQVTLRRLNRSEYRNTIRDLMGIEFESEVEFPPDDTGHGFDTVGDAMSVSPLLMEKYLQAAEQIVFQAVPLKHRIPAQNIVSGRTFVSAEGKQLDRLISFYDAVDVQAEFNVEHAAEYELEFVTTIHGGFDFDPGRCKTILQLDDAELISSEHAWGDRGQQVERFTRPLSAGTHRIRWTLQPLVDKTQRQNDVRFEIKEFRISGPTDPALWISPPGYDRFFPRSQPPTEPSEQQAYAGEVLQRFASRAFRRPVDEATLQRLTNLASHLIESRQATFEQAVARSMVAVLASPRFLFRIEHGLAADAHEPFPRLDEYALASRLSYFLWSTMPDERLWQLAEQRLLRNELDTEVARMIADPRFRNVSESFVGQWLQTRDVETISIDPLEAIGARAEYDALRDQLREKFGRDRSQYESDDHPPDILKMLVRYRELRELRDSLTNDLRRDLRRETEELFHYIASQDRSLLELIDSRYSFLNQRLAKFYGLTSIDESQLDERELQRIELPHGSPRGGVLTQGSILMVTSNPTRTSPVKRGLFILENILGTPSAPPPAAVPELEAASSAFAGRQPTLRELLAHHRQDALCASCHNRFDPLGLALENFNAVGKWRDSEAGVPVDASGQLITGETFSDVQQLKYLLSHQRQGDFYRCFATKLMTYALGRGPEYHDELALDQIVSELEAKQGRFSSVVLGVIRSPPFDRLRRK